MNLSKDGDVTLIYHEDMLQGSQEWLQARCGLLTASEMKRIMTPNGKAASNDKARAHIFELAAQRITGYVEPSYIGDDMLRGINDEVEAKIIYDREFGKIETVGFVTNDKWGFTIGYSPDGAVVGGEGLIECKSRRQKFQLETILFDEVPSEHMVQLQTGLLVTERQWIDYVSYCGGMPLYVKRVYAEEDMQQDILEAARAAETSIENAVNAFRELEPDMIRTERKIYNEEITL